MSRIAASLSSAAATARLVSGDLAEPALVSCFLDAVEEVVEHRLEAGHLAGIGPKLWASDTRVFIDTGVP
jgi:hypothetical protein